EVGNAPPELVQGDSEGDQPERVLLALRTRENSALAEAAIPSTRQSEQPAVDEPADEMLLGDVDMSISPPIAQLAQQGHKDVPDHVGGAGARLEFFEHLLGARLVITLQRSEHPGPRLAGVAQACRGSASPSDPKPG